MSALGSINFTPNGIAIGGDTANVTLDLSGAIDAIAMPVGSTAQRPSGLPGMFRYSTDLNNFEAYINGAWREFSNANAIAAGVSNSFFGSGYVQYTGPDQSLVANINFIFGNNLPNPSGVPAPCFLLGSGVQNVWYITDQAYTTDNAGINVGMTAGETQPASLQPGGSFSIYGGGAANGTGGQTLIQGGTSVWGAGGDLTLSGGGSTHNVSGNVYVIGGQTGNQGGSIKLIATTLAGSPGYVYFYSNSTILYAFANTGAIFVGGTNQGLAGQPLVSGGPGATANWLSTGVTANITTAKISTGGANGWMNFVNGILVGQLSAT